MAEPVTDHGVTQDARDRGGHVELARPLGTGDTPVSLVPAPAGARRLWLPNVLTVLRLALVPVILGLLLTGTPTADRWSFVAFVVAALTDKVDGWAARRWHSVTRWGQLADPIADKALVLGTLAGLAALGRLPWWAVLVIALREVVITVLRVRLVSRYRLVLPANRWGKAKTLSQVVAVALFLLPSATDVTRFAVLYVAIGLTVVSGWQYALHVARLVREREQVHVRP
ncbi:MAG TPA: CDP-diacylglycerol--glycerol-3-phosphate 3-phosphatidyltransferase [Nitriliruptorales bacterium]|nr:CDP-diacylglycerol--glycerol-3-phosphate 3-phosphatidyltransferase [Nitriliruptorales bacterium]